MGSKFKNEPGFSLLITLIVVGAVLSIGMSILNLSIKQVQLSTTARDSEIAFNAANAGVECATYWRRASATAMESGGAITPVCFGVGTYSNTINATVPQLDGPTDGEVNLYTYSFTWGVANPHCTIVNTLVASSSILGPGVTTTNMTALLPGYVDGNDSYCEPGSLCTTISVKGYNHPCNAINGYGVVEREVLLQF